MAELVRRSLRMNPSRVIVGEVLGDEIVTMLNAMSQGNDGSLSTIHANCSLEVFNRISTYAIQCVERLPSDATMMLIAGAIDFVVFIERDNEYAEGGSLRRMVTSVREVNGVDGRVLSSEVFARGRDGYAVPAAADRVHGRAGGGRLPGRRGRDLGGAGRMTAHAQHPPDRPARCGRRWRGGPAGRGAGRRSRSTSEPAGRRSRPWPRGSAAAAGCRGDRRGPARPAADPVAGRRGRRAAARAVLDRAVRRRRGPSGAIARLEGLAAWTESLRDTIAGAVGLEQAIPATAYAASPAMPAELLALSDRLRVRTPLPAALQRFAEDIADAGADLIIAALILNSRLRGPGLREVLTSLAESARAGAGHAAADLCQPGQHPAQRADRRRRSPSPSSSGMCVFNRDYVEPYTSPFGQVVLVLVVAIFAAGFMWLRAAREVRPARAVPPLPAHGGGPMTLTLVMLAGAVVGCGVIVAVWLVAQPSTSGPVALALLDARLARGRREASLTSDRRHAEESLRMRRVGARIGDLVEGQGIQLPARLDADLGMVGQSREMFFARTAGGAVLGAVLPNAVLIPFAVTGLIGFAIPLWLVIFGAVVGALVPYLELARQAREKRRAFRHMVGAFLDLVAMNLAGGRGVPGGAAGRLDA